ncbi:hypothetical protein GCM10009801_26160 [Streptomyces albiaxialis]|uniref:HTH lysR-type domain-containing protein n=1 Tax=Streptomyces albiaxialis TaxID=329523 RepID=A0ABN2VV50_9ACTN
MAVAEERSFTRAAARLHVARPGVSTQIRLRERELKQELLDRSARTVRLTDVGATVLPYAREALAALSRIREAVAEHTGLLRGRVSLGMVTSSATAYDLPHLLAEFHKEHPAIEVTLAEAASDELLNSLRAGRFDAVTISSPTSPRRAWAWRSSPPPTPAPAPIPSARPRSPTPRCARTSSSPGARRPP